MYKNFIESFFQLIEEVNQFDKSKLFDYQVHKRPVTGFALQRDLYTNGSTKNSFSLSRHYKEEYPKQEITRMKKNALLNFDYNMRFFDKLDKETYNANINAVLERFPFTQVTSLLEIDRQDSGVYLLCLDDYNQFYVGQGKIFNRITKHWRTTLSIDRLVFGTVEDSRLSIDSFGVFDTKRIFVFPTIHDGKDVSEYRMDLLEEEIVYNVDNDYVINRTIGGNIDGLFEAQVLRFTRDLL